jgi:hypothetical protein
VSWYAEAISWEKQYLNVTTRESAKAL